MGVVKVPQPYAHMAIIVCESRCLKMTTVALDSQGAIMFELH